MNKRLLILASLLGALSVGLGAFGAHGLRKIFPPDAMSLFETGLRYQFYHVFALLATGILAGRQPASRAFSLAGKFFIAGILLFSGSLYLLAAAKAGQISLPEIFGLVTPLGGLSLITGWVFLGIGVWKSQK